MLSALVLILPLSKLQPRNFFCFPGTGSLNQSVPQNLFGSYFQKVKIFLFGKESVFRFRKNHPLSGDAKFKLLLCMSLVFCATRNVSLNDDNHILKFFTEGFENLPSSFFLIPKICYQVLSSAREVSFRYLQQDGR